MTLFVADLNTVKDFEQSVSANATLSKHIVVDVFEYSGNGKALLGFHLAKVSKLDTEKFMTYLKKQYPKAEIS